ncbi:MAG: hypothetical protein VXZ63_01120, partial [Planctomycetota bacterium]|nr:hypothetical protein [Planctomycetota bacterium]
PAPAAGFPHWDLESESLPNHWATVPGLLHVEVEANQSTGADWNCTGNRKLRSRGAMCPVLDDARYSRS